MDAPDKSPYYKSLKPLKESHFRLLSFHRRSLAGQEASTTVRELKTGQYPLGSYWPYRALSYTWDKPTVGDDSTTIWIDGQAHAIGPNLFHALHQLARSYPNSWFWVDKLCINQGDREEREELVGRMGEVYHYALEVIIWLGLADTSIWEGSNDTVTAHVFKLVEKVAKIDDKKFAAVFRLDFLTKLELPDLNDNIWGKYLDLYERRWFERGWVIQEVVPAKPMSAKVLCGPYEVTWDVIRDGSKIFLPDHLQTKLFAKFRPSIGGAFRSLGRNTHRIRRIEEYVQLKATDALLVVQGCTGARDIVHAEYMLLHLMRMSRDFHWHNEKDRIYSMIGIIRIMRKDLTLTIVSDYRESTEPAMVLMDFAKTIVWQSQCVGIISQVSDERNRELSHLPSWVPCFRLPPVYANGQKHPFIAGKGFSSTDKSFFLFHGDTLEVKAIKIGTIAKTQDIEMDEPANIPDLQSLAQRADLSNAQSHDELLWRTLIWNMYNMHDTLGDKCPADETVGKWYHSWVKHVTDTDIQARISIWKRLRSTRAI